jgi:hypothetical protein
MTGDRIASGMADWSLNCQTTYVEGVICMAGAFTQTSLSATGTTPWTIKIRE